jgi:cobalt/nickel transport system ATP-binding protein
VGGNRNGQQFAPGLDGGIIPVLEADALFYRYAGYEEYALHGASLRLMPGQKVALMGRNGSGKSTLLLHCNGILRPERGDVRVAGVRMGYDRASLKRWRQQVGLIFQQPDDQLFSASVMQDISFGPLNLGLSDEDARQRVQVAARLCGVVDVLDRPTHALSGGEKARVALAGVLAMEPLVVLADEVTASLDPWMRRQVFDIFDRLVEQGKTVLLSTHDIHTARTWADSIVVMDSGRVVEPDEAAAVLAGL